LNSNRF